MFCIENFLFDGKVCQIDEKIVGLQTNSVDLLNFYVKSLGFLLSKLYSNTVT